MNETFKVESRDDGAWFELRAHTATDFLAQAESRGIRVTAQIDVGYLRYATTSLANFFGSLASDWKGWEGERQWGSTGSDFALRAESDGKGHVGLTVFLRNGAWKINLRLVLEAGQLERIARDARDFEDAVLQAA